MQRDLVEALQRDVALGHLGGGGDLDAEPRLPELAPDRTWAAP